MILHPARRKAAQDLDSQPADEWREIYRRVALYEHPHEMRLGYQVAFYSPLAVPELAQLLDRTGHFRRTPLRRAYDTGLVMYEIINDGLEGPRADKMVRLMNTLHGRQAIDNDAMLYVLCSLIVCPTRQVARAGWRPLTEAEKQATVTWYGRLAQRMGIETPPTTYAEAERFHEAYTSAHVAESAASRSVGAATLSVLGARMKFLSPWARPITVAVIGDRRLTQALGLGSPSAFWEATIRVALDARKHLLRLTPPPSRPIFTPGQRAGRAYPHGYALEQLGPDLHTEAL